MGRWVLFSFIFPFFLKMDKGLTSSSRILDRDSQDDGDEFVGLGSLNHVPIHLSISEGTHSVGVNFDLPDMEDVDENGDVGGSSAVKLDTSCVAASPSDKEASRVKFFESKASFNSRSAFVGETLSSRFTSGYCDLSKGYRVHSPKDVDRMWMSPCEGWQAIPTLWSEYGLRLPMHPFFLTVLEELDCGVAQLSSNAVLQIHGVIARCTQLQTYSSRRSQVVTSPQPSEEDAY